MKTKRELSLEIELLRTREQLFVTTMKAIQMELDVNKLKLHTLLSEADAMEATENDAQQGSSRNVREKKKVTPQNNKSRNACNSQKSQKSADEPLPAS